MDHRGARFQLRAVRATLAAHPAPNSNTNHHTDPNSHANPDSYGNAHLDPNTNSNSNPDADADSMASRGFYP